MVVIKHLGDICKISGYEAPPVNVIIGGFPCQDLSCAGNKAGLAGERSGLFFEIIRLIKEMRDRDVKAGRKGTDIRPRFVVLENVPHLLSINGGRDFAAVLEETIRVVEPEAPNISPLDYQWTLSGCFVGKQWSVAWRVLDAQFWGVPQRRRRIALVADFGGQCAQEILFERCRSQGNSESCETQRERTSGDASDSFRAASGIFGKLGFGWWEPRGRDLNSDSPETAGTGFGETGFGYWQPGIQTLRAGHEGNDYHNNVVVSDTVALEGNGSRESHQGDGYSETDTMYTLNTVEQHSVCYSIPAFNSGGMISDNPNTGYNPNDVARTLDTMGGDPTGYQGGIAVVQAAPDQAEPIVLESNQNHATITDSGVSPTLSASMGLGGGYVPMITAEDPSVYPDVARTLTSRYDSSPCIDRGQEFVVYESHDQDARYTPLGETCSTVSAKYGTGGGNAPMVVSCGNGQSNIASQVSEEVAGTLNCMHDQQIICAAVDCRNGTEDADTNGTFKAKPNGGTSLNYNNVVRQSYIVRRLTPLEAERLQGLPSYYEMDVSKMTKDEYIAWNLASGNIIADPETGKVYAIRGPGGIKLERPKELKGSNTHGYRSVAIRNGHTKLHCFVHRIIWISVNGVLPDGYVIDHINNNKTDNRISNLQLLTPEENSHKARADGLYKCGLDNKATKLDPSLKDEIAFIYAISGITQRKLATMYGISKSRVNQIIKEVGWTDIGEWVDSKGKKHRPADAPRYKAIGNGIAVPPWLWVLSRLNQYCGEDKTMASLFNGISTFPLIWSFLNGKENCTWSSEVDEFCIALSKIRFPDTDE